jgi:hypothetical protein
VFSRRNLFGLSATAVVAAMTVAVFPEFANAEAGHQSRRRDDDRDGPQQTTDEKTYGSGYGNSSGYEYGYDGR